MLRQIVWYFKRSENAGRSVGDFGTAIWGTRTTDVVAAASACIPPHAPWAIIGAKMSFGRPEPRP